MPSMIGRTISRYTIQRELGHGGMGRVYLAVDNKLGRPVALKFLSKEIEQRPYFRARLIEEARAAAAVDHVFVCKIYEIEEFEETTFLVLEFVQGQTLDDRLRSGPLCADDILRIACESAEALAEAHARNVLHRDIKPPNIMLTEQGHVKVMDFGLAQRQDTDMQVTRPEGILGTPVYMAPEQLAGKEGDARSDIFSLGLVLYEMAWGENPFQRNSLEATIGAILYADLKPPGSTVEGLPADFTRIVRRMLDKSPAARYAAMKDVWMELVQADRSRSSVGSAPSPEPEEPEKSVAVLPFSDLSPNRDQEYFCDGLVEELINVLMRVPALRVASRTSSFRLKGHDYDIRDAAAQLNVRAVVEGSLRRAGDRLRVVVKLIDAETASPIWSETFESKVTEVFEIQDAVATGVARRLETSFLKTAAHSLGTTQFRAYDQFLLGRFAWNRRTADDLRKSIEYYRKALSLQPDYAPALAAMAEAYATLALYGAMHPSEARLQVKEASAKALAIDPKSAMARTALACIHAICDLNWAEAERGFKAAIETDSKYALSHHWYANVVLIPLQRFDEARVEAKRALELDPVAFIAITPGIMFLMERRYFQAIAELEKTVKDDPGFGMTHYFIGQALGQLQQYDAAIKSLEMARSLTGNSPEVISMLGYTYARMGKPFEAAATIDELNHMSHDRYVSPLLTAQILTGLERFDEALRYVQHAQQIGATDLIWLRVRPQFEPLRDQLATR
jgi:serine/threonine protein kinase/tetratricopeptide (TPR) repeat protein